MRGVCGLNREVRMVRVSTDINSITLKPGEMLTVWLDTRIEPGGREALQVELRVLRDGTRQIFVDQTEDVELLAFKEWTDGLRSSPRVKHVGFSEVVDVYEREAR